LPLLNHREYIGRLTFTFAFYAFDKAILHKNRVGLDAGFLGEIVKNGLDQLEFACRVDVDFTRGIGLSAAPYTSAGKRLSKDRERFHDCLYYVKIKPTATRLRES